MRANVHGGRRLFMAPGNLALGAKGGAKGAGELTSLDIHKSIKSLFPDKGGEGKKGLRPYLPRVVKDAWRLDKKSLPKGAKKRSGVSRR